MSYPTNLFFTEEHEWISSTKGTATIGITSYAVEQLGDIVHLDLPDVGSSFNSKDPFGTVESTKTVSDLYMPGKGKVLEVNTELLKNPEALAHDPFHKGWLVKVQLDGEITGLMSATQYTAYTQV